MQADVDTHISHMAWKLEHARSLYEQLISELERVRDEERRSRASGAPGSRSAPVLDDERPEATIGQPVS